MLPSYRPRRWAKLLWIGAGLCLAGCGAISSPAPKSAAAPVSTTTRYPLTVHDEAGHLVTLSHQPQRIASTTEGTDEILAALVPKSRVVLVTTFASDPAYSNVVGWAKGIPALSSANAEAIIATHPDLVLAASYTTPGVVQQIEQTGIPVYEFTDFNSIPAIEQNILNVGRLVGEVPKAEALVHHMQASLATISHSLKGQPSVSVLDYSSYGFAAGRKTTVNNVIRDAGGTNAAAKLQGWQKISDESIVKMNPSVIIDAKDDAGFVQKLMHDPALATVSAIRHHRVYLINSADLSSVSQYVVQTVKDVARVLHPGVAVQ